MKKILVVLFIVNCNVLFAGIAETDSVLKKINFSTYFESYYTYDLDNNSSTKLSGFVNHHKNNEVAINIALIRANYNSEKFRANLGGMIGTYSDKNYTGLDAAYKYIYESNVGVRLLKNEQLWFDVGIFPSHIGMESAIGMDNWTLTRSLQAEASPYYEAGAKLSYQSKNEKWYFGLLLINGWQVISKQSNYPLSLGTQIQYKPNHKILINSSSYIGNNNSYSKTFLSPRYFHNFYTQIHWSSKISTALGFDIGAEEYWNFDNLYNLWYSPVFIARYSPNYTHAFAIRAEYLNDVERNVFFINSPIGFKGFGYSLNYDLQINKYSMFRVEGKILNTKDAIFYDGNTYQNINKSISIAFISFIK